MVNLTYLTWFVIVLLLFSKQPPTKAVITAFIAGVLFLPEVSRQPIYIGMPDPMRIGSFFMMTKINVISVSVLLGTLVYDKQRLLAFRPQWYDAPIIVWCFVPLVSDYLVGETINDLYGQTRDHFLRWGVPYLMGRLYLRDVASFKQLAVAIMYGALIYAPLCIFESLRGPYWHHKVYGYFQHDIAQMEREGTTRPMVFMEHGLQLGMFMALGAMVAFWLWQTGTLAVLYWRRNSPPLPMLWVMLGLVVLVTRLKSMGALVLCMAGIVAMFVTRWTKVPIAVLAALFAIPALYIEKRVDGTLKTKETALWVKTNYIENSWFGAPSEETKKSRDARAQSYLFRMENEDKLLPRVMERPLFGWGDTGKSLGVKRLTKWDPKVIPDGEWIITFGTYGWVGLITEHVVLLFPTLLFLLRYRGREWSRPWLAPVAVLAVFLPLFVIDCLSNAMINPIYILTLGGLTSFAGVGIRETPAEPARPVASLPEPEPEPEPTENGEAIQEGPAAAPPGVLVRRLPGK